MLDVTVYNVVMQLCINRQLNPGSSSPGNTSTSIRSLSHLSAYFQVRMMEERLVKGEYCLSTSGVGSPPHSLPSTSGTQNDKIEDGHCACISKLETQVEEQVNGTVSHAEQTCDRVRTSALSEHKEGREKERVIID